MKNKFLVCSALFAFTFLTACGGAEEAEPTDTTESNETETTESTNSGGLNDLINNAVDQVENEVNQQISDPNSELLQGVDTLKDIIEEKVEPAINEITDKIKLEVEK
ncbi:MAG: hypothetical protein ABJG68_02015 [Crocinitomicaceae bacterium]